MTGDDHVLAGGRPLTGRLHVCGDKSISHRALIVQHLSETPCEIVGLNTGRDVTATGHALAELEQRGKNLGYIWCGNSGTTMRLLAGLLAGRDGCDISLHGDDSLSQRPMMRVVAPLTAMGATISGDDRDGDVYAPLTVRGSRLRGVRYTLSAPSAQVRDASLLAGLHADGETIISTPHTTRSHLVPLLRRSGVDVTSVHDGHQHHYRISSQRPVRAPERLIVHGDPSAAAHWIVAALLTPDSDVTVDGLLASPHRLTYARVLERMGADLTWEYALDDDRAVTLSLRARTSTLTPTTVSASETAACIDELPLLALAAATATGTTTFWDASELRLKESDRISEIMRLLRHVQGRGDYDHRTGELRIHGHADLLHGTPQYAHRPTHYDHRIVMLYAVAAISGLMLMDTRGLGAGWSTSYPAFRTDLETLRDR